MAGQRGVRANMALYAVSRLVARGLTVLLLPVYTRVLAPAEMGIVVVVLAVTGIMRFAVAPGIEGSYLRWAYANSSARARSEGGTLIILHLALLSLGLGLLAVFAHGVTALLLPGVPAWPFYYTILATVGLDSLGAPLRAGWRAERRADMIAALEIGQSLVSVAVILGALLLLRWGPISILFGELAAGALALPLSARKIVLGLSGGWDGGVFRRVLPMTVAGLPLTLSTWALSALDRIFLHRLSGPEEVGLYGVAYQVGAALMMVMVILNKEWQILVFSFEATGREHEADLQQLWARSVCLFLAAGGSVALFSHEIARFVLGERYVGGASIIPLVVVIAALKVPREFIIHLGWATGRAAAVSLESLLSVAVFVLANLVLIPLLGARGAASAGICAFATGVLFLFSRAWNRFRVDRRMIGWTGLFLGVVMLSTSAPGTAATWALGVLVSAMAVHQGLAYWTFLGALRRVEGRL